MSYKFSTIIEKDKHGYYAFCPALDGCHSQGDTLEEVMENMKEALSLYISTLSETELQELSIKQIFSTVLEVQVA